MPRIKNESVPVSRHSGKGNRRPGSHHYHLAFPGKPGTLEISEWQGEVWFSVNERRDCGWVSDFARTTAAALGQAPAGC